MLITIYIIIILGLALFASILLIMRLNKYKVKDLKAPNAYIQNLCGLHCKPVDLYLWVAELPSYLVSVDLINREVIDAYDGIKFGEVVKQIGGTIYIKPYTKFEGI